MGEHGDSEFAVWSHANIAGVNLEEFLKDTQNVQEAELVELFEGVRDAAYTIINKKGAMKGKSIDFYRLYMESIYGLF